MLKAIIERIDPPNSAGVGDVARSLIFDSYYDDYRGVVLYIRSVDGEIKKNDQIKMMATGAEGLALEVGSLSPDMKPSDSIKTGEIGYIVTNLRTTREAKVGDTVNTFW